jgi:hypothetical protein
VTKEMTEAGNPSGAGQFVACSVAFVARRQSAT